MFLSVLKRSELFFINQFLNYFSLALFKIISFCRLKNLKFKKMTKNDQNTKKSLIKIKDAIKLS